MDIIAKLIVKLNCSSCDNSESQFLSWTNENNGGWAGAEPFSRFDVVWDKHTSRPEVTKATCQQCGIPAKVTLMVAEGETRNMIPFPLSFRSSERLEPTRQTKGRRINH